MFRLIRLKLLVAASVVAVCALAGPAGASAAVVPASCSITGTIVAPGAVNATCTGAPMGALVCAGTLSLGALSGTCNVTSGPYSPASCVLNGTWTAAGGTWSGSISIGCVLATGGTVECRYEGGGPYKKGKKKTVFFSGVMKGSCLVP